MNEDGRFDIVLRSPVMVDRKDKQGWVELFADDGFIEDPVEAGRYRGHAGLSKFWDIFIGPQPSIAFDVKRDFCGGKTLIRQATVQTVTEADEQAVLEVPALLEYRVEGGKVASLRAIWEPRKVVAWFLHRGGAGIKVLGWQGVRMTGKAGLAKAMSWGKTVMGGMSPARTHALLDAIRRAERQPWIEYFGRAEISVAQDREQTDFVRDPGSAFDCLRDHVGGAQRLDIDQLVVCGHHVGAFLKDEQDRALAVMMRANPNGTAASIDLIWSPEREVLGESAAAAAE